MKRAWMTVMATFGMVFFASLCPGSSLPSSSAVGLTAARSRHTATLLPSRKVLVVGGDGELKEQNTQDEKFEEVVNSAEQAAVLVLVY